MTGDLSESDIRAAQHALWRTGLLEYKLWLQQEPIYHGVRSLPDNVETVVVLCARQFGKSHLGVLMAVEDCLRHPGKCILVVGPTQKQTVEIVAPRIREIMRDAPAGLIRRSKSEGKWYIDEAELVIGGFDQNSSSQRGKAVQTIYIEEVVDSNPDDYTESMRSDLGPALTHSKGGKMIFLTTLPKIPSHPFILDTIPEAKLNGAFYSYTIDDNAQLSSEQYDACVRRCGGKDTEAFRREYLNELVRDSSTTIVPAFDRSRHVREINVPSGGFWHIMGDWGGVRDKTVALRMTYDFYRNKYLVNAEKVWDANTPTETILPGLRAMENDYPIDSRYIDCPGQLQVDLVASGYELRLPLKDDWQAGINQMQVVFSLDQIEIDPSCRFLIQTLESGQFNRQKNDFERTGALGHCDAAAALMYGLRMCRRDNPFPSLAVPQTRFERRVEVKPEEKLAEVTVPKAFGEGFDGFGAKKFGRFK